MTPQPGLIVREAPQPKAESGKTAFPDGMARDLAPGGLQVGYPRPPPPPKANRG
ncbi:hypothetical protein GCM10022419_020100 [Nonomuraea rosea]|uniref:Uncharacterized protein n=1 Tax=Nonomuraea rosea TaxID=638574 RepID=A0ABP6VR27_9ACTN